MKTIEMIKHTQSITSIPYGAYTVYPSPVESGPIIPSETYIAIIHI